MSPIFGAAFLWLVATILWWSGWREEPAGELPHWTVGVFLSVWPIALFGNIRLTPAYSVNGAWAWTVLAVLFVALRLPPASRWKAISAGLLVGAVALLLERLAFAAYGFVHGFLPWGIALIVGLLAALSFRSLNEQALAITASELFAGGTAALLASQAGPFSSEWTAQWLCAWWIAVLFARAWTELAAAFGKLAAKGLLGSGEKGGEQRS
ncbi:hypothetical protein ACF3MZ_06895 [Paenibacillaceae bacterium WGS1546]|uniref:hypothetical protein n=1 Tax=Cohnella sp. WGS1546 TaxID=3366810 RepID=UPI00372D0FA9